MQVIARLGLALPLTGPRAGDPMGCILLGGGSALLVASHEVEEAHLGRVPTYFGRSQV